MSFNISNLFFLVEAAAKGKRSISTQEVCNMFSWFFYSQPSREISEHGNSPPFMIVTFSPKRDGKVVMNYQRKPFRLGGISIRLKLSFYAPCCVYWKFRWGVCGRSRLKLGWRHSTTEFFFITVSPPSMTILSLTFLIGVVEFCGPLTTSIFNWLGEGFAR